MPPPPIPASLPVPDPPRRILPAILFCQVAGTSIWFSGNAVIGQLQALLGGGERLLGWLTSAAQLGFVLGTLLFTVLRVADRFSPRWLFAVCAAMGAVLNAAVALAPAVGGDAGTALLLVARLATGVMLAGIYPVGMKIAAGWYRERLGNALGLLVGALVLGTALPHGAKALFAGLPWQATIFTSSTLALAGALLMAWLVPDGPYLAPRLRPGSAGGSPAGRAVEGGRMPLFATPQLRAVALGYFGHMWELYTFWAFVPALLAGYAAASGQALDVPLWSFAVVGAGALGCAGGGWLSQRLGSAPVAFTLLAISCACCLLSPLALAAPPAVALGLLLVWGVAVAGDSPQFSTLAARHAPAAVVGTVLTSMNCLGFALTIASIEVAGHLLRWAGPQWMFVPVALGPLVGLVFFRRMLRT